MPGFGNGFDTDTPIGSNPASKLDTYIEADTKKPIAERYALEHYPLNSAEIGATDPTNPNAQGRHVPGLVGVLLSGTTAEINSFVSTHAGNGIGIGAIALNTETGFLLRWNGSTFTNIGLTAVVYTSGDGIIVLNDESGNTISIDPASEADVNDGISDTKVVTPSVLKYAYGLTPTLEAKQVQPSGTGEVIEASPYERKWNVVYTNTIEGADLINDYQIILPPGVYEIMNTQPMFTSPGATYNSRCWLYNETAGTIVRDLTDSDITSTSHYADVNRYEENMIFMHGAFSISEESTLTIRCSHDVKGIPATIADVSETYGHLIIRKKKLEI